MGYDENQYSLPRWHDITISRAGMYDDMYTHLPTQGWMFVPIGDYHAGGDAAAFQDHPEEFEWALAQYLGAGTAACYRGAELWNNATEAGKKIKASTEKWVRFYKNHRETLIQPVVHLRRADMQDWDGSVFGEASCRPGHNYLTAQRHRSHTHTLAPSMFYVRIGQLASRSSIRIEQRNRGRHDLQPYRRPDRTSRQLTSLLYWRSGYGASLR